ncbi:MAG TPA: thiamine pyrophosphate-binding protein [Bacteroidales bacterium]|nr:thiamine pyrophosphate-binding protein [Bacteroidales bacterium]
MTIAEYIANQLYINGIRYVFGIPGGPSIPYMEAFRSAGIEFILTSNEASAAIMADVTARLTGVPGVCHSTFGPGATNITTGVGGALLDRSPVIVFTSEINDEMLRRTTQMNIDHQKLFEPLVKATMRMTAANVAEIMNNALRICQGSYPGPVHIGLPAGIAGMHTEAVPNVVMPEPNDYFHNDIHKVISLLEKSRRPLLAVGLTAARVGIRDSLLSFIDHYRIPVVVTPMAKGILEEDHPCYTGVLFHALSDFIEDIYENTDLVIGLGYDQVEFNYESWMPDVPLVHFDTKETDLPSGGMVAPYWGPADEWFSLLKNLNSGNLIFEETLIKGIRDEMESVFMGFTGHFGPVAAMKILYDELPDDTIVTSDVGSHLHLLGQFWKTKGKKNILMTNGWSGMGFGIPSALAAQMNERDGTVVCITGDGGFLMMAGELITARRYNLPVITVVFSDGELNLIKVKQSWRDISPYGTLLYQGDLFESDMFLGIKVLKAWSADSMRQAVIEALAVNEPVIINAAIDPEDYKWLIVRR